MRLLFVLLAALCASAPASAESGPRDPCVLTTRWNPLPPYWVAREGQPPTGYLAELLAELGRRTGCEMRFREMNWARGVAEMRAGRVDLIAGDVQSPERDRFARFTRPINATRNVLLLRAELVATVDVGDLSALAATELRIGIQAGANYGPEYVALARDPAFAARLRPILEPKSGWQMLESDRLDGLFIDELSALNYQADTSGRVPLKQVFIFSDEPSRVMVGRHLDAEKAEALDRAIDAMVSDGWLPRLREAWIPCPTDPSTMGCRIDQP
ncbi:substrate-binding periplasmic protein [Silanimonas sp.]|jgi:polar amino acid transport system substrate-binding protein|uniref:substrate-binding periplasmic protein n=1 Tax=Silanimonas sp. TaxID=1929290 RepID=UPI0037C6D880